MGNIIFTISDDVTYYEKTPIVQNNNKCTVSYIPQNNIVQTVFSKCAPLMVCVLQGTGENLYDKALSLYNTYNVTVVGSSFSVFYTNILIYGMLRYILSRLLYGDFNINYLLQKYYKQFLVDLGKSRFCNFLENFINCNSQIFGFGQYFLSGSKVCKQLY